MKDNREKPQILTFEELEPINVWHYYSNHLLIIRIIADSFSLHWLIVSVELTTEKLSWKSALNLNLSWLQAAVFFATQPPHQAWQGNESKHQKQVSVALNQGFTLHCFFCFLMRMFYPQAHSDRISVLRLTDRTIISASYDRTVKLWDRNTKKQVHRSTFWHFEKYT